MRFVAVATDYDGTLAREGLVDQVTMASIRRLLDSGRSLVLVTGRMIDDLLGAWPEAGLCQRIVAENGAVLYRPSSKDQVILGPPPSGPFVEQLQSRGVHPLVIGQSIIATTRPHAVAVFETIRDLGLEHHVVFNRESVMILPPGINKATGLKKALNELQFSSRNVVAIGDSENDHALLQAGEYAVAVGNAIPQLKANADKVTQGHEGEGVREIISELIKDDLAGVTSHLARHEIHLGLLSDDTIMTISPVMDNLLIAGSSGSGKSSLATGILQRLAHSGYQFCVIDPEGDYESFDKAIVFGNAQRGPTVPEVMTALENPRAQIIINLLGLPLEDRPRFFLELFPRLQECRAKTGRPHRILVDETHHLLPPDWQPMPVVWTKHLQGMLFVTVHPEQVSKLVLESIDVVMALGQRPDRTLKAFAARLGLSAPRTRRGQLKVGEAIVWRVRSGEPPKTLRITPSDGERRRHRRKYAEGQLGPDRSFYFKGPRGELNLRAQNLTSFMQLAQGVDDATWTYHLKQGDYSRWMEVAIKDFPLARLIHQIENESALSAKDSRQRVTKAIEERYTWPAVSG